MPGGTAAPLVDRELIRQFRSWVLEASGVKEPTVLAINLEGRFPSAAALVELIVPLGEVARAQTLGPLAVVLCTTDEGVRQTVRAVAFTQDLALYLAPAVDRLAEAEPVGPLTPSDQHTLEVLRGLGGRATVATFAGATGLEAPAATNRLMNVQKKGMVHRVERSRREGVLFVDPRAATSFEDLADPTSGDYLVPEPLRRDVRALADMQGRDSGEARVSAWRELLTGNSEHLDADHQAMRAARERGDTAELARLAKRYTKKQAQARARRLSG
jgi:hypothetical protein